jgi:hypothetical protein
MIAVVVVVVVVEIPAYERRLGYQVIVQCDVVVVDRTDQ